MQFYYGEHSEKMSREFKNHENGIKIMSAVLENRYTLFDKFAIENS